MNKQVTFGHILTILAVVIIPLMLWGVNVERRFEKVVENSKDIRELKVDYINSSRVIYNNHEEVMQQLHNIELQLKDKANRK